jgi:N-acetylglucosaminyldiphosphoundecaprenol N-acetyl-beta-D-mannosaminyltransferase
VGDEKTRERINLLKVPIDIVAPDELAPLIYELLVSGTEQNIVLLSLWDLLRARRKGEYRNYVTRAALVIPISKSIVQGLWFLSGRKAVRYMPFDFIVNLLMILENREFSTYLLGSGKNILTKAEKNLRQTFPKLRIVGRFTGSFKRHEEATIIEAIRKASPALLLAGNGIHGGELWIARNSGRLGRGLRLWCSDIFDVFADRRRHPSRAVFDFGLEWIGCCLHNPLKLLRVFPWIYYNILLLFDKLFDK